MKLTSRFWPLLVFTFVGYQGIETIKAYHKMIAPTFLSVGDVKQYSLADLKVTGYTPVDQDGGCFGGDIIIHQLNASGYYESAMYYWIDDGDLAAGWYASLGGDPIEGGAASVKFDGNRALWILCGGDAEKDLTVVGAGQVNTEEVRYPTIRAGHIALGNGTPVNLTLDDLSVTDYEAECCYGGDIIIHQLNPSGYYESAMYYWIDDGDVAAGWYASLGGDPIEGGPTSVSIPAGKGLWVLQGGDTDPNYKYRIVIPGVDLSK